MRSAIDGWASILHHRSHISHRPQASTIYRGGVRFGHFPFAFKPRRYQAAGSRESA